MMKYYSDTSIPMPRFISATIDHDLKALLIDPVERELNEDEEEELQQALLKINSDYLILIEDSSASVYANRLQLIAELSLRIIRFRMLAKALATHYSQSFALELKEEFPYSFDMLNPDALADDISNVFTELIADEIELERLQRIEALEEEKHGKTDKPTKQTFTDQLFEINHQEGVKYNLSDLTLADFAALIKRLKMHYKKPRQPQTA